jgi:hypothetical protein
MGSAARPPSGVLNLIPGGHSLGYVITGGVARKRDTMDVLASVLLFQGVGREADSKLVSRVTKGQIETVPSHEGCRVFTWNTPFVEIVVFSDIANSLRKQFVVQQL